MKCFRYIAAMALPFLIASCDLKIDRELIPAEEEFVAPVLSEISDVISDFPTAGEEEVVYTWNKADYGVNANVLYTLYAKLAETPAPEEGEETAEPLVAELGQTNSPYFAIKKGDIVGAVVNELGAPENKEVEVVTYVEASVNGSDVVTRLKSNEISYTVFTFIAPIRSIYLPGRYQGWNQTGTEMWETAGGTNIYKMLVDVSNDNADDKGIYYFKVVTDNWYGFDVFKPGWTVADPASNDKNFSVTSEEPIIIVTVDTKKKTIDREVISAVTLTGDFNNWATDDTEPEFTYDAANNVWLSPAISFTAGQGWAIRLNKDWARKYSAPASESKYIEGGLVLTENGGDNIPAPGTGSYVVKLHANRTPFEIEYVQQ